ncbi:MAG: hypothetical protein Q9209_001249 [Squamulea sp. 1 TL-2023]
MEVVPVLGAAASVATVLELSTACINKLLDLRTRYKISDLKVHVFIAQLSTLKAALAEISAWACTSSNSIPHQLKMDLNLSLSSCKTLVDALDGHLSSTGVDNVRGMSFGSKTNRTQVEQESLLEHPESRKIICSVRDDSSSLLWLRDKDSCGTRRSVFTESSESLDTSFAFDVEVFKSRAYLSATRSNMKRAVRGSYQRDHYLEIPQRQATNELSDKPPAANQRKWMLDTRQATSKLPGSSESDTMFSEPRQDQSPDTRSIASSVSPTHSSSGKVVGNPIRHRMLYMPSLIKSRDSFSKFSRASTKHDPSKQNFENGRDETQILLCSNSFDSFFAAIPRISKPGYEPTVEDISHASTKNQGVQDVSIPRKFASKRYQYQFINNTGDGPNDSKWVYASDDVSLLIHVVDSAAYDVTSNSTVTTNHFRQGLALFQKVCASRWLAETPVLVLLSNTAEMAQNLLHSPIRDFFPEYAGESGNVTQAKQFFRDLYLRVERKYDMCVWVDFVEGGATVATGKSVIGIIDKIFTEKSVLSYGLR